MNLLIDSGNSFAKVAIFENNKLIYSHQFQKINIEKINILKEKFPSLINCIISTVTTSEIKFMEFLSHHFENVINLDFNTKIPLENLYLSGKTLGPDRIALVVGANNIFPDTNVLVVDLGSAITFDFITNKNQYSGGNISPGLSMRFKALNKFTKKLPLLNKSEIYSMISDNTENAIISGVQKGIIYEIEGYIYDSQIKFPDLKIILSGGDAFFFENKLKIRTFAKPDLIFYGLNRILEYNGIN